MAARCDACQGDHPTEDHYCEAFTNPVTREPYPTPKALQSAAIRICRSYSIGGIADPQYIANVIATELAIGDGASSFASGVVAIDLDADPHGDVFDMPDPTVDELRQIADELDLPPDGRPRADLDTIERLRVVADRIEATIRREAAQR